MADKIDYDQEFGIDANALVPIRFRVSPTVGGDHLCLEFWTERGDRLAVAIPEHALDRLGEEIAKAAETCRERLAQPRN